MSDKSVHTGALGGRSCPTGKGPPRAECKASGSPLVPCRTWTRSLHLGGGALGLPPPDRAGTRVDGEDKAAGPVERSWSLGAWGGRVLWTRTHGSQAFPAASLCVIHTHTPAPTPERAWEPGPLGSPSTPSRACSLNTEGVRIQGDSGARTRGLESRQDRASHCSGTQGSTGERQGHSGDTAAQRERKGIGEQRRWQDTNRAPGARHRGRAWLRTDQSTSLVPASSCSVDVGRLSHYRIKAKQIKGRLLLQLRGSDPPAGPLGRRHGVDRTPPLQAVGEPASSLMQLSGTSAPPPGWLASGSFRGPPHPKPLSHLVNLPFWPLVPSVPGLQSPFRSEGPL